MAGPGSEDVSASSSARSEHAHAHAPHAQEEASVTQSDCEDVAADLACELQCPLCAKLMLRPLAVCANGA